MRQIRDKFIQPANPRSLSARARARRWSVLLRHFPEIGSMHVLDLGGELRFWRAAPVRPEYVTMVNLKNVPDADEPWIRYVVGNACHAEFPTADYDIVISNSLLEHVGGPKERHRLADVIHGAARRHWVQTPNRYFPIEPHWLFPGFQFLPFGARVFVTRTWPLGHRRHRNRKRAADSVAQVELIGPGEMRRLFPTSLLWVERLAGFPKSLVAIRSGT